MNIGERIKTALEGCTISVADIAGRCHVSVQAVYKWKRGEVKNLEAQNLFTLEEITGYSARWIGTGHGPEKTVQQNDRSKRMADLYAKLDDRSQDTLLRIAESDLEYLKKNDPDKDKPQ